MKTTIEKLDTVWINFNNAKFTLSKKAIVLYVPVATGDSWKFQDIDTQQVHYVSEGCTITLLEKYQQ